MYGNQEFLHAIHPITRAMKNEATIEKVCRCRFIQGPHGFTVNRGVISLMN
jgi:hypothetical protein